MLIFVSDLHFIDESAGEHNIPTIAFKGAFDDIKDCCKTPEEVKIIFLGDVFDLLRTTYWLDKDESERPWGDVVNKKGRIESHANAIMDLILQKNRTTFDFFKTGLRNIFKEPEVIYVPGNHDRLCNMFESLRKKVRENLGMPVVTDPFPHCYDDIKYDNKYCVFARHGHEYDIWNYEGTANYADSDYEQVPIGDLITTEIAARLPYTIMEHVDKMASPLSPGERSNLERNLKEIDNVRPASAMLQWLFYQVRENPKIQNEINLAVTEIAGNFNRLDMVQRWYKRHDKWSLFVPDEADKLQAAIGMFKVFNVGAAEELMKVLSKIFGSLDSVSLDNGDDILIQQAQDFLSRPSDYRYMVMGHTHNPLQIPIRITSNGVEQVYLNTGTWRKRYIRGRTDGFLGIKHLTFTIFYSEKENGPQSFETWTGSLQE